MNAQLSKHEIPIEPLATRVALHPVLAGMNRTQLTLLTDCAVARHFSTAQTTLAPFTRKCLDCTNRAVRPLVSVRLEDARNRLLNPNLRISEIAYDVGFQSLTQFNRTFKRVFGQSPTEFRASVSSGGRMSKRI